MAMENIRQLLAKLSPEAYDLAINAKRVLSGESLNAEQTWALLCLLPISFAILN